MYPPFSFLMDISQIPRQNPITRGRTFEFRLSSGHFVSAQFP